MGLRVIVAAREREACLVAACTTLCATAMCQIRDCSPVDVCVDAILRNQVRQLQVGEKDSSLSLSHKSIALQKDTTKFRVYRV